MNKEIKNDSINNIIKSDDDEMNYIHDNILENEVKSTTIPTIQMNDQEFIESSIEATNNITDKNNDDINKEEYFISSFPNSTSTGMMN